MAEFPTYEEMAKNVAEKALDEFLYDGKSIREWMQIIASEDCISRQEVLDILKDTWNMFSDANDAMQESIDTIEAFRSVIPKPKMGWIPVSEHLPNDRRPVLVTAYWHETYQVMMASYFGDGLWWCVPFNNCGKHEQKLNPKAWLPLPEPYKAESEEV